MDAASGGLAWSIDFGPNVPSSSPPLQQQNRSMSRSMRPTVPKLDMSVPAWSPTSPTPTLIFNLDPDSTILDPRSKFKPVMNLFCYHLLGLQQQPPPICPRRTNCRRAEREWGRGNRPRGSCLSGAQHGENEQGRPRGRGEGSFFYVSKFRKSREHVTGAPEKKKKTHHSLTMSDSPLPVSAHSQDYCRGFSEQSESSGPLTPRH